MIENAGVSLARLDREIVARGRFYDFLRIAWPHVVPDKFKGGRALEEICEHLEAVSRREIRKLIINVPPGSTKSLSACVFWPVWKWIDDPSHRWMYASFDVGLCRRDAGKSINLIQSQWFQERWPHVQLADSNPGETEFDTTKGGFRFATSPQGKGTGRHVDTQVCDDPLKPGDATGVRGVSMKQIELVNEWWGSTMANRKANPETFCRVIIMQRLHEKDLAGHCEALGDYEILRLPMRYEERRPCKTSVGGDWRTTEGELLNPDRFPESEVKSQEDDLGPQQAAAQMQQRPTPESGLIFKKEHFRRWTILPEKFDRVLQSWDMTFKGLATSDFVEGDVWGYLAKDCRKTGCLRGYYLLDSVRGKWRFTKSIEMVKTLTEKWPEATTKLIEDKANGPAVEDVLRQQLDGVILVNPQGSKIARANAVQPLYEAGNVFHPDPERFPWVADRESQLLKFPLDANDDGVDTTTQALLRMRVRGKLLEALEAQ